MRYREPKNNWDVQFEEDYRQNLKDIERDVIALENVTKGIEDGTIESIPLDNSVTSQKIKDGEVGRTKLYGNVGVIAGLELIIVNTIEKTITVSYSGHVMNNEVALYIDAAKQTPITNYENIVPVGTVGVCYFDTSDGKVKYMPYNTTPSDRFIILFYLRDNIVYGQSNLRGVKLISPDGTSSTIITSADLPTNRKVEKAIYIGTGEVVFDFDAATITFPGTGFIAYKTNVYVPAVVSIAGVSVVSGLHNIYFDINDRTYKIFRFDNLSPAVQNENLLWICSYYISGDTTRVTADFSYSITINGFTKRNLKYDDKRAEKAYLVTNPDSYVRFDNVAKKITFPLCWVVWKNYYISPSNLIIDYPSTLNDGIYWVYFKSDTKNFGMVHFKGDLSVIDDNTLILATCYMSEVTTGAFEIKTVTAEFAFEITDNGYTNRIAKNKQVEHVQILGRSEVNFDFANGQIDFGQCYVMYKRAFWQIANSVVLFDSSKDGIQFIYFNSKDSTVVIKHYQDNKDDITGEYFLIGSFWGNNQQMVSVAFPYKINGTYPWQLKSNASFSPTEDRLVLGPKMFFIKGNELPIYKSSILSSNEKIDTYKVLLNTNDSKGKPRNRFFNEELIAKGEDLQNTLRFVIKQKSDFDKLYYRDVVRVMVDPEKKSGQSITVLMMGDSITNRNLPEFLEGRLADFNVTATMVGTMYNQSTAKGEGREGWEYENFIGKDNTHMTGNVITRLETGEDSTLFQNPFLKLATEEDKTNHPTWCFRNTGSNMEESYATATDKTGDFYIFDFAYYLANHNIQTPDIVTIALSTNDFSQENPFTAMTNCRLGLEIMIKQIRAVLPNTKIGIIPTPVYGGNKGGNNRWVMACNWIDQAITDLKTHNISNIEIVPIWQHMSRETSFDWTDGGTVTSTSEMHVATIGDNIHLSESGKREYIEALVSFVMNVI